VSHHLAVLNYVIKDSHSSKTSLLTPKHYILILHIQSTHKDNNDHGFYCSSHAYLWYDSGVDTGNSTYGTARHEHNANSHCGETNANKTTSNKVSASNSKYDLSITFASFPTLFQSVEKFAAAEGFV
jgi:hypothetical protein